MSRGLNQDHNQSANNSLYRVVFPDSLDDRIFQAAKILVENDIAQPVLIGNPLEIRDYCLKHQLRMGAIEVIDPKRAPIRTQFIEELSKKMPKASVEEIEARVGEPLWFAALLLDAGYVDFCIAGNISSTANVLRAGIRVIGLEEGNKTVSSIMFMIPPDETLASGENILAFADCAVVPEPTELQLADIAQQTARNFNNALEKEPRVAMLSFSSHGSARHPSAEKMSNATKAIMARAPQLIIDGELQFDAAFVPSVAQQKVPSSPLKGEANVFIFPTLDAANIGYKIAQRLGGYDAVGPLIQGLRLPIHDLSRGCSAKEIVQVLKLAIAMAAL